MLQSSKMKLPLHLQPCIHLARPGITLWAPSNLLKHVPPAVIQGLAEQLEEAGASHFLFTLGQNSGRYAAPNATYDRIVGREPGFLSKRDLMSDLYEALSRRGIALLAYLPSNCPEQDPLALKQFRWEEDAPRRRPFQELWEAIIREWSLL